jgi:membrane-associated protease RseP (regulator of RpoE activity)
LPFDQPVFFEPRRKFQHKYLWPVVLFLLTLGSTTFIGWVHAAGFADAKGIDPRSISWMNGFWFSIPLLAIISAHEFGHYWYCRRYNIDASLPYFLPFPLSLAGTIGAVIRIREPFPSKQALFDVAVAGPIAGFIALVPFLVWGMTQSTAVPPTPNADYLGEPLLLKGMAWLWFGSLPQGWDEVLHPTAFAAWFGLLVTALNLLPFGQLDGGHISYAAVGRHARFVSGATLVGTFLLTFWSVSFIATAIIMLAMAYFLGLRHPQIPDEDVPLDNRRRLIALVAVVIFAISFTPLPIEIASSTGR